MPLRSAKLAIHRHSRSLPGCIPHACTGLHNLHQAAPLTPAQACTISAGTVRLKPAKPAIHRHQQSPLLCPVPFRHARPTLQRPPNSPQWKASAVGPWDPTHLPPATGGLQTCLRDTRRQVLDAQGVTSEQLRLQFYFLELVGFFSLLYKICFLVCCLITHHLSQFWVFFPFSFPLFSLPFFFLSLSPF
jgi:hypothetical protein